MTKREDDVAVRGLFAKAALVRGDVLRHYDEIDCGLILCFALALHKLDSLTDEAYLGVVRETLSKALVDLKHDRQAQTMEAQGDAESTAEQVGEGRGD